VRIHGFYGKMAESRNIANVVTLAPESLNILKYFFGNSCISGFFSLPPRAPPLNFEEPAIEIRAHIPVFP
jgi:hypothetical protein